ncbi:MAG: putative redox protein [Actinomycetota bacterium]|nr:putative redox protein [Actinomycetota bacterium]
MGTQRLLWTGEGLQFLGHTTYGSAVQIGGDVRGHGAKPSDLLPLSLAACTAYDTVVILKKQRQDLQSLEVEIATVQDHDPPWAFRSIHMRFVLTGVVDLVKAEKAVGLAESKYCAVAATLRSVVDLSHSVEVNP